MHMQNPQAVLFWGCNDAPVEWVQTFMDSSLAAMQASIGVMAAEMEDSQDMVQVQLSACVCVCVCVYVCVCVCVCVRVCVCVTIGSSENLCYVCNNAPPKACQKLHSFLAVYVNIMAAEME